VIKNICPRLVALSAEIGIDATASLLTDLVITGQIDLTGEGIAQLVNILVGITHSKGNFDHFLDTHAGDVTNTNQYTRVTVNQEPSTGETPHQPTRAEQLSTITNSNPNVRDFTDENGNKISVSQEISTRLDEYPQYQNEIVDYMSVQRRRADDTTNPIEFLDTYIQTLNEFPQHKEFITRLANDPNLDGQSIRNIITEHGNNLPVQLKSDILLIASKGHDAQGINYYLRLFEQNPEFRNSFKTETPDFELIDNSTPTPQIQAYRNTIVNKINNTCPQELQTLKQTLGDEFFNKIKWKDILPENATQKEITETIEYLNDCSKFFSRITTNEQRYGKNLAWAHNMNIISENAQIKIANGGNFDDVIYGIANEYRFYDVSTTLDSNNNLDDGTDRRFSSGKDRSTRPDYYRSSTSFNQDNYGNYFERFMKINPQDIKKPYNDAGQTYILPLEKDSGAMLHPEPSTIKASMKHASDAYNNLQPLIQKAQSGQKLNSEEIQQFHNNAAEIYYLVAHAMPWERGSNG
ncbi:hypothetical protein IJO12_07875, partial [bacterium]|nr:hypothetical protein [bacterium]